MLLWFAGLSVFIAWHVFRDPTFDYRLVIIGALLPDIVDGIAGGLGIGHTLVASVVLLIVVMAATRDRRLARRRALALPIGTLLHLLLDGVWGYAEVFWWPVRGGFGDESLPSLDRPVMVVVVQELMGLAALLWWRRARAEVIP